MTTTSGWRQRWAAQETARRLTQYHESLRRWEAVQAQLRWHRELAESAASRPTTTRPELKLRKGEEVFWESGGVVMVEVADTLSLFSPVHTVFSPTLASGGYVHLPRTQGSERDSGHVVVTNQRVFFDGVRGNREWLFAQLTGVAHGLATPMTFMRVSNRQRLSGLVLDGTAALAFQFFLSLGIAVHRNDRAGFVAHLSQLESHHAGQRPSLPVAVAPEEAPSRGLSGLRLGRTILFGRPGAPALRKVAPSFLLALVVVCAWAAFAAPPSAKRPTSSSAAAVTQTTLTPATVVMPSPTSSPSVVVIPSPSTAAAATTAAAPPPPPPPPAPPANSLCGAPPNPWNFTFCAGGSTISSPPTDFCSYFNCIDSFWKNTNGYVMECKDHMFSHSGGVQGSCSYHGGNNRSLRQP
jgi:hypothetical protein